MNKILVTGSNGFIGGHILRTLSRYGYAVCGCGRGENKNQGIPYLRANLAEGFQCNINFDLIIHAAARSPEASFEEYFFDNVIGTQNILDFAKQNSVRKIVYLSAVSSFGRVDKVLSEESPHDSPGDYGLTKYMAEKLICNSGLDYDIYILPGVVGMGCNNPYIVRLAESLYQWHDVYCYNSEGIFNNVLLVSDLSRFLLHRLETDNAKDVFLLGCTEHISVHDMVSSLMENLHSSSKIELVPEVRGGFYLNTQKALNAGFVSTSFADIITIVCNEVRRRLK